MYVVGLGSVLLLAPHATTSGVRAVPCDAGYSPDDHHLQALARTLEFRGGSWLDGDTFIRKTMYSVAGVLRAVAPSRVDSIVDLTGKFVVPPFADAHVHDLADTATLRDEVDTYLAAGVYYLMEMDPSREIGPALLSRVNCPTSVDVVYTQGLVTPSWGVMADMYSMMAASGRFGPRTTLPQVDTREVFLIDNASDLARKWPALAAKNHEFVKVILAFSEDFAKRRSNPAYTAKPPQYSAKPGFDPALLPDLVTRAHRAGLRVATHIETAGDFRVALASGVDIIAHLPAAWQIGPKTGFRDGRLDHWELTDEDAARAAAQHVVVITTTSKDSADPDGRIFARLYRHNLALLTRHHVKVVIGSDSRDGTAPTEALYLAKLRVMPNAAVLRMLTSSTARAIFPGRKLGALKDGYEASFLVLDGNPLASLEQIRHIAIRVKDGRLIPVSTPASTQTEG